MRSKLVNGDGLGLAWSQRVYGVCLHRNLLPQDPYLFLFSLTIGLLDVVSDPLGMAIAQI
jgi:hypothetical protein